MGFILTIWDLFGPGPAPWPLPFTFGPGPAPWPLPFTFWPGPAPWPDRLVLGRAGPGRAPLMEAKGYSRRVFFLPEMDIILFVGNVFYVLSRKSEFGAGFFTNLPSFPTCIGKCSYTFWESWEPLIFLTHLFVLLYTLLFCLY